MLEKLGAHKTVTGQIIKLREEVTDITDRIGDLETKLKAEGDPSAGLQKAMDALRSINNQRADRTQAWAQEIERLSSGKIKAAVAVAGDISEIREALDGVAGKTGSQEATRIDRLNDALAKNSAADIVDRLRTDCLSLLYWRQMGAASGEDQRNAPTS